MKRLPSKKKAVQAKPAPRTQAKAPQSPSKAVKAVPVAASSAASRKVSAAASKTRGASSDRFVIIMAGGRGERFWPVSREKTPKQLIRLLGDRSFLQQAVDRVRRWLVSKQRSMRYLQRMRLVYSCSSSEAEQHCFE